MNALVTGSAGHLGEALVRTLQAQDRPVRGIDITASLFTHHVGSITDRPLVNDLMQGVQVVYHTATLHKPHVATHTPQDFIDTNITGTLSLLEAAVANGVQAFIFTSTTSVFGDAMQADAAGTPIWVDESLTPIPKNIYGVTKAAAEELCHLFHRLQRLPCVILRTSRFFPEDDDDRQRRQEFDSDNMKANEFLFRRVDIEDVVSAHQSAARHAERLGFGRYIISATTPFTPNDLPALGQEAPSVVERLIPDYRLIYTARDWRMFDAIGRVYSNAAARRDLHWEPSHSFASLMKRLASGGDFQSDLAAAIGRKGYHEQVFDDGPYPVG